MALGTGVAVFTLRGSPTYVASSRLIVSGTTDKTDPGALADTVRAIATTRSQLLRAIDDAGVERDPGQLVDDVSVSAVGSSGIVEISVVDRDRVSAAGLTNALTGNVAQELRTTQLTTVPLPSILDAADPASAKMIPAIRVQDVALGALLGFFLGIGIAALLEAVNPTVVGREAIASELGAPVLGVLPLTPDGDTGDFPWVRWQLGARAGRAGVATLRLTTVGPRIDLSQLSAGLVTNGTAPPPRPVTGHAGGQPTNLRIGVLDRATSVSVYPDEAAGLVVVTPETVKKSDMDTAKELVRITGWPVVGAIVYRRRRRRSGRSPARDRGEGSDARPLDGDR